MNLDLLKIKGVGSATKNKLHSLGIFNIQELINFLPTSYIDFDNVSSLENANSGEYAVGHLLVLKVNPLFRRGKLTISRIICKDAFSPKRVEVVWYNAKFIQHALSCGDEIVCYGKVTVNKCVKFSNPLFRLKRDQKEIEDFSGIKPIYPTRGLISQGVFSKIVKNALEIHLVYSVIDEIEHSKYRIISLEDAYQICHCPTNYAHIEEARSRVRLEETVRLMSAFEISRSENLRGYFYQKDETFISKYAKLLPFTLSPSQQNTITILIEEMCNSPYPINTIIAGDVGSGKTVVALLLSLFVALSGYQVAVIAPTGILASQHYSTFLPILKKANIRTGILTSSTSSKERKDILEKLSTGEIKVIIGTHSLISSEIDFKNLSLVITDEQHRFGVVQRTSLIKKGIACDLLSLSATPIPRSYQMMLLGNVKTQYIENRRDTSNVKTYIVPNKKLNSMLQYVISECQKGRQAFIVVPRVYDVEGQETSSIEALSKKINKEYGDKIKTTVLHGKMRPEDKDLKLNEFISKKTSVLLTTSLIEVGIDIPSVSIIVIMDADKFGLASLHQLRGRVGRLGQFAECFLFSQNINAGDRLAILVNERDGLRIAEKDYENRGPGEFFGTNQSGQKSVFSGLTIEEIEDAIVISKSVDLFLHYPLLLDYAMDYGLENIELH